MAYKTALYLRLSVDDENVSESDSIANQRDLLEKYVAANPALSSGEVLTFSDDGWSGTNFERPGVKRLLDLVRQGEIRCVIVKDLSRWGRNYVEVAEYIEKIFPFLGVRFIAVGDRYDSADYMGQTAPLDVSFNSIAHDIYCRELSVKVRQSYIAKAKKGEFLCGTAPFGFIKSKTEKNKLVIDKEAAGVVRRIFQLACDGLTTSQIAAALNSEGVDTPLMYRKRLGRMLRGHRSIVSEHGFWTDKNIRTILSDERYIGTQVSGKTRKPKPGSRKTQYLPESEWIKAPNAHDAIVSNEVFEQASMVIHRFQRTGKYAGIRILFAYKIRCGHCGRALGHQHSSNPYHFCASSKLNNGLGCFTGKVYIEDLKATLLTVIKVEAQKALDRRRKCRQAAVGLSTSKGELLSERGRLTAQIGLFERRSIRLYEEFADGKLDREDYLSAKSTLAEELASTGARIAALTERLEQLIPTAPIQDDEPLLCRVLEADDVTEEILSLVERITVFDPEHIEIQFAFSNGNMVIGQ